MTHTFYLLPGDFLMVCLKFFGQHISRLTDNLDILHGGIIYQNIILKVFKVDSINNGKDIV